MNIVLDENVKLNDTLRNCLNPLLPEGITPFILKAENGIDGTPKDNEGMVFITNLPVDVMAYHGQFFRKYSNVPQWFFLLCSEDEFGISLLKDAQHKYSLNNCRFFYAKDEKTLDEYIKKIAQAKQRLSGKALVYSKHEMQQTQALADFLFEKNPQKYEIAFADSGAQTDASYLLVCAKELSDFKNVTVPEDMEPFFVVLEPEKHLQQYIHPDFLHKALAEEFHMTQERVAERLFFVSTTGQRCIQKQKEGAEALNEGFLMWDSFGLPVSREAYTEENIRTFVNETYFDGERLKAYLNIK